MPHNESGSTDFYEREAKTYDERRWVSPAGRHVNEIQTAIVCELAGDVRNKRVLDVATGTGRFALNLARLGAQVSAIDSAKSMLTIAQDKFAGAGLADAAEFHEGSAAALPFADESFDLCVCINALNHIPEYETVISEIHRVLRKGGCCITNYTNWLSPYLPFGLAVNIRGKSVTRDVYTKWFSPTEVYRLHRRAGLELEEVRGAVQIPSFIKSRSALRAMARIDSLFRNSRFGPLIFVKASKRR